MQNHVISGGTLRDLVLLPVIRKLQLKDILSKSESELKNLLVTIIKTFNDESLFEYSNQIVFSWESLFNNKLNTFPSHILKAHDAVQNSKVIIIIGYSFPLYNRPIDTFILNEISLYAL